jgi:hypothetical protein
VRFHLQKRNKSVKSTTEAVFPAALDAETGGSLSHLGQQISDQAGKQKKTFKRYRNVPVEEKQKSSLTQGTCPKSIVPEWVVYIST